MNYKGTISRNPPVSSGRFAQLFCFRLTADHWIGTYTTFYVLCRDIPWCGDSLAGTSDIPGQGRSAFRDGRHELSLLQC